MSTSKRMKPRAGAQMATRLAKTYTVNAGFMRFVPP
jgi:hypothetical protein